MHVRIRCHKDCVRQWHVLLAERLQGLHGITVSLDLGPCAAALPAGTEALFHLEATIHGLPGLGTVARVTPSVLPFIQEKAEPADLVIDLCGDMAADAPQVWRLTYNDVNGEEALLSIILSGETPLARIMEQDRVVAEGRLGTEYGGIALASFQDVLARTTTLLVAAISGTASAHLPALPGGAVTPPKKLSAERLGVSAARQLAGQVARHIYRLCYNTPHWQVGWRKLDGPDLFDLRSHPETGWTMLADDGRRFYADPFPIVHDGRLTLFVEDYEHKLAKGIISAVTFDAAGPVGRPVPVLEQACHLSYPFVFEKEGQVWMIPESCANRSVDLFRATAFPGGWVKEATLLSDIVASDATLIEHGGCWWMLATVRDGGGAFSDTLHIWSAPDFRGPWVPHRRNPVLVDIGSARPAGRMTWRNGHLLRPVQDCRKGYGAVLGIARIRQLDPLGFEQTVEAVLTAGRLWPGRRLHTLNSAGGIEFIDGSAKSPRWKRT